MKNYQKVLGEILQEGMLGKGFCVCLRDASCEGSRGYDAKYLLRFNNKGGRLADAEIYVGGYWVNASEYINKHCNYNNGVQPSAHVYLYLDAITQCKKSNFSNWLHENIKNKVVVPVNEKSTKTVKAQRFLALSDLQGLYDKYLEVMNKE